MDVKALQARLAAFAAERGWDEMHNPRNLAIALAGEAGMLLDLFRWLTDAQSQGIESEYKREAAAEAIADLILHTLRLADKLDIDVERAVAKKLAENDANYPRPASAHAPPVVVVPVAVPAPRPAEKAEKVEKPEKPERIEKAEKKEVPRPVEAPKAAPPPEPVAPPPAPAPQEAKVAASSRMARTVFRLSPIHECLGVGE
jgi:dCTP diphosphatase